jgi:hypothetical protein
MNKIFPLSSGAWLMSCGAVYLIVSLVNHFVYPFTRIEYIQAVWMLIMSLPLWIRMKWLVSVDSIWDQLK